MPIELENTIRDVNNQATQVLDGLDEIHSKIFDNVLTQRLPFVADALEDAKGTSADKLQELRSHVNTFFTTVNGIVDTLSEENLTAALQTALGDYMPDGFVPVAELVGDDRIDFTVHLQGTVIDATFSPAFDLGIDALGLTVDGNVNIAFTYDFRFKFGATTTGGFFIDLGATGNDPEFELNLAITTPGLSAEGRLAFLQLNVQDDPVTPSSFTASLLVDLTDGPDADSLLFVGEIGQLGVSANLSGAVDLNFKTVVSFGGSAVFPSLHADLNIDWAFNSAGITSGGGLTSFGSEPTLAFNNVAIDVGTFFDNFVAPVVNTVRDVLAPIRPAIDVLTTRMPVLSDISLLRSKFDGNNDGTVTLLETIAVLSPSPAIKFIETVVAIDELVGKIPTGIGGNTLISLGSFSLNDNSGVDIRGLTDFSGISLTTFNAEDIAAQLTSLGAMIGGDLGGKIGGFLGNIAADAFNETAARGLEFPLLENPASAFKLLLGQDVELFTFDAPKLGASFHMDEFFPILGPLGVNLKGDFEIAAKFAFGFDTYGIRQFADGGFANAALIFDGFYVSDRLNPDGTGADVPEIKLLASIEAFASFDIIVAAAGVGGGIKAVVTADLNDPNDDGKVRITELADNFPLCIFDLEGTLTASLSAFIRVGVNVPLVGFVGWQDRFNLASATLLDFTYTCTDDPEVQPVLAHVEDGVLILHMGPNSGLRAHGDTADGDENFVVKHVSGAAGNEVVTVTSFGYTQEFGGVNSIYAEGGAGNDIINLEFGVLSSATLYGDFSDPGQAGIFGDDQIFGGNGFNIIYGGGGHDELSARVAGSSLYGGDGDDTLYGGSGNDTMDGGAGDDAMYGAGGNDSMLGGAGDDFLDGGEGNDTLLGGAGDDYANGGAGNDYIDGGAGNDILVGGADADSILGGDGNDWILGDVGTITVVGDTATVSLGLGGGNDTLRGGAGFDALYGQGGNDLMYGDADDDYMEGNAGNDTMYGGTGHDDMLGGDGDDLMEGEAGNDTMLGEAGNDTMLGGTGNDSMLGGAGNDSMSGGDGNDYMEGNDGNDTMLGNAGNDTMLGGTGADSMLGGAGSDSMSGGDGNDYMEGNADNDTMFGDAGNDTMLGGTGNDSMLGGAGADLMYGGDGDDHMEGNADNDTMYGDAGNDSMYGGTGADSMFGGTGADYMEGNDGADYMEGNDGNDTMHGNAGNDTMYGNAGDDSMLGGAGMDLMYGNDGADYMEGNDDDDTMYGNAGNDTMHGNAGDDYMEGGSGDDLMYGGTGDDDMIGDNATAGLATGDDSIYGGDGHDVIAADNATITRSYESGVLVRFISTGLQNNAPVRTVVLLDLHTLGGHDFVDAGNGDDTVWGQAGNDSILGGAGDDDLIGNDGHDTIDGGTGDDGILGDNGTIVGTILDGSTTTTISSQDTLVTATIDVAGTKKRYITLTASAGDGNDVLLGGLGNDSIHGGGGADLIYGDELDGSALTGGNDALFGNEGQDTIYGGGGDDHIYGGAGDDYLDGDTGADILYGGDGDDTLVADQIGDRLIDWLGNFNNFVVPDNSYGAKTILRSPAPKLQQFLVDLGMGDGSTDPYEELQLVAPSDNTNSGKGGRTK